MAVSDGEARVVIMVLAAGHNGFRGMPVHAEKLAALVERYAGHFPVESRMDHLQAATSEGPGLRLDSRFPDEWLEATRTDG